MKGFWKGISWIEISIVGSLIVVLSLLTVPNFHLFTCRAQQSEAKFNLALIYATEKLHKDEFGHYASLKYLQETQRIKLNSKFYRYSTVSAGSKGFSVQAEGIGKSQVAGDAWTIDHNNDLTSVFNVCAAG